MFRACLYLLAVLSIGSAGAAARRDDCTSCHSKIAHAGPGERLHKPLRSSSSCVMCHVEQSQGSGHVQFQPLTAAGTNGLCLSCHDELKRATQAHHMFHSAISQKSCIACHDPHKSSHVHLLRKEPAELCLTCHASKGESARGALHHKLLGFKENCLSCHNPHFGRDDRSLLGDKTEINVCLNCHAKPQARAGGGSLAPISRPGEAGEVHPPFKEGECTKCHEIHGSKNDNLVEKNVCFKCHDQNLVTSQKPEATRFRNGTLNLHAFHLKGGQFERTCFTCHEPHESHQARLIRSDFLAFGTRVPIQYSRSENGGGCATACHKTFSYNRVDAVKNDSDR